MNKPNSIRAIKKALKGATARIYAGRSSYEPCFNLNVNIMVKDGDGRDVTFVAFSAQANDLFHYNYKASRVSGQPESNLTIIPMVGIGTWYAAKMEARVDVLSSFRMDYESAERCLNFAKIVNPVAKKHYAAFPDCEVSRILLALSELGVKMDVYDIKVSRERGGDVGLDEWNANRVDRS